VRAQSHSPGSIKLMLFHVVQFYLTTYLTWLNNKEQHYERTKI